MLWYKTYGTDSNKDWLVFVHGAGGSSTIWHPQLRFFTSSYNVLILDLRGHGRSTENTSLSVASYSFKTLVDDIYEVLESLSLDRAHFVGVSLGTLLIREFAHYYPERILSIIHTGAITKLDFRSRTLIQFGHLAKRFIPFFTLYKLFAWIIMPGRSHREARELFKQQASQISQEEFIRWFELTYLVDDVLNRFSTVDPKIPTLFVMGDKDHLFLGPLRQVLSNLSTAKLVIIENCGHVCNIERPESFNQTVIDFLRNSS